MIWATFILSVFLSLIAAQMPMGGVTVSPAATPNYMFTAFSLSGPRNDFTGCVGFRFQAPSSSPPTITSLCRWNKSGNTQTHDVYLEDGSGVVAHVTIDALLGTPGTNQCVSITPTTLSTSAYYYVGSSETNGGDSWYDLSTTGTFDATYGSPLGALVITCNGAASGGGSGTNASYVPINLTRQ